MRDPESLSVLAAQCRSLAGQTAHGGTAAMLRETAADYDAQAKALVGTAGPKPANGTPPDG